MTDDEILHACIIAISQETDNPPLSITPHMTASDVPGWDSLAHVRIFLAIGSRLGVVIDIEKTYRAGTIGDLVPIIRQSL